MIQVYKVLYETLNKVIPSYLINVNKTDVIFPYCTYNLGRSIDETADTIFPLVVDVWDEDVNSYFNLIEKSEEIKKLLTNKVLDAEDYFVIIRLLGENIIPDSEPNIKRQEIRFEAKVFSKRKVVI